MIIRKAQIEELGKSALRNFENEMVDHLAKFSPPLYRVLKEDGMRQAVRFGIRRADGYNFTYRGPIRLYLELMLLFGSHFDTDPQYPWATEILKDRHSVSQMQRAEWLYAKTLDYQKKVTGINDSNSRQALEKVLSFAQKPLPFPADDLKNGIRREIKLAFPQKIAYIGEEPLATLIDEAIAEAHKYGFSVPRAETLMIVLMFAFGHGCAEDPLYPWIGRTLKDEKILESEARAGRLEKKAVTWLEYVLAPSNEGAQM